MFQNIARNFPSHCTYRQLKLGIFVEAFIEHIPGSRNPLRTSTWCGLVGTNGRCAPLLSAKVGICQLKISIGTRKLTLTATKHQDNSLSDIRLQDSTRTMMTRWRFAEDFSRKPHRSSTRCALVGTDGRCALSLSAKVGICQPEPL